MRFFWGSQASNTLYAQIECQPDMLFLAVLPVVPSIGKYDLGITRVLLRNLRYRMMLLAIDGLRTVSSSPLMTRNQ